MDVWRIILGWAAFAVFHSLTVSEGYEQLARRAMGGGGFDGRHRPLLTASPAAASLVLVLYLRTIPDAPLYRLKGFGRLLFHAVQLCGVAFLFWTPWDLLEFVGVRQWERSRKGAPQGPVREARHL